MLLRRAHIKAICQVDINRTTINSNINLLMVDHLQDSTIRDLLTLAMMVMGHHLVNMEDHRKGMVGHQEDTGDLHQIGNKVHLTRLSNRHMEAAEADILAKGMVVDTKPWYLIYLWVEFTPAWYVLGWSLYDYENNGKVTRGWVEGGMGICFRSRASRGYHLHIR